MFEYYNQIQSGFWIPFWRMDVSKSFTTIISHDYPTDKICGICSSDAVCRCRVERRMKLWQHYKWQKHHTGISRTHGNMQGSLPFMISAPVIPTPRKSMPLPIKNWKYGLPTIKIIFLSSHGSNRRQISGNTDQKEGEESFHPYNTLLLNSRFRNWSHKALMYI